MMVKFVDFPKQYHKYQAELDNAWHGVAERGDLILREDVEEFEEKLAAFVGTGYAVGVNSGTDALFLSLKMLGIKEGDEVITVGHTFHATVEVIHHCGATPVLVNVGKDSMMDLEEVKSKITENTRAIIPVHLMGDMVDMKALAEMTDLPIIEDACQALGAEIDGKRAGAWGLTGCFSFYPAKILGSFGDAGAITTDDKEMADELKDLRNHYKYNPGKFGYNSRLDNLQAALLNVKIDHLPEMLTRRREISQIYDHLLQDVDITLPTLRHGRVYQDYIIRTDRRDELADFLEDNGIQTMKNDYHFPDSLPKPQDTIELERQTLRLPCNDVLEDIEIMYVVKMVREFYEK